MSRSSLTAPAVLLDRLFQTKSAPVNRVRFGQPPVKRAVLCVHFFREHRVNFEFFAKQRGVGERLGIMLGLILGFKLGELGMRVG